MMHEILKPLMDNSILTDETKGDLEKFLSEAIESAVVEAKSEVESLAKENFDAATKKFEEVMKTLEESYKTKLSEAGATLESKSAELALVNDELSSLKANPYINLSDEDLNEAELKIREEVIDECEIAFDLAKTKFEAAVEVIESGHISIIENLETELEDAQNTIAILSEKVTELEESLAEAEANNDVEMAITTLREELESKHAAEIAKLKENLTVTTEIFLEQEMEPLKAEYAEVLKETKGRELLESLKSVVKDYWDIDKEVVSDVMKVKNDSENKVEQYKTMLQKEHNRLEEAMDEIAVLKKKVIIASKASVLSQDKKESLEKLADSMDVEHLETNIDSLMESVITTFHSGFSKKEVQSQVTSESGVSKESQLMESATVISSGDTIGKVPVKVGDSEEISKILALAGIK